MAEDERTAHPGSGKQVQVGNDVCPHCGRPIDHPDGIHSDVPGPFSSKHGHHETELSDELEALKRFHGHLGPYLILGYKMGLKARELFPQRIYATVLSGSARPRSCMADGVQFSSCCTIGKSNIVIREEGQARAMFTDLHTAIEVEVLPEVLLRIDGHMTHDNEDAMSLMFFQEDDSKLFRISQIDPSIAWPIAQQR